MKKINEFRKVKINDITNDIISRSQQYQINESLMIETRKLDFDLVES